MRQETVQAAIQPAAILIPIVTCLNTAYIFTAKLHNGRLGHKSGLRGFFRRQVEHLGEVIKKHCTASAILLASFQRVSSSSL
jgi:hypothetical protein